MIRSAARQLLLLAFNLVQLVSYSQDVQITPEGLEIKSVFFAGGSYALDDAQKKEVHAWLTAKENLHEYEIQVHSHTDNIGSVSYNQFLSRMRSESALIMLEEIMIHRDDVLVKDYGELNPHFDNLTLEGRLSNRRVDIILVPPST